MAHADRFGLQLTSAAAAQKAARSLEPTDQASLSAGLTLTPADTIAAIAPQSSASAKAAKAATPAAPAQTAPASERSFAVTSARAQSGAASLDAHSDVKSVASLTERAKDVSTVSVAQQGDEVSVPSVLPVLKLIRLKTKLPTQAPSRALSVAVPRQQQALTLALMHL